MSKGLRLALAGILLVIGLFGEQILDFVKDNVEIINTPSVNIPEPELEYKTLVEPIVAMDIDFNDAKQISVFFTTLSDVVEFDPGFVDTTEKFMVFNKTSGGLNFSGLKINDKYDKLGESIDMAIANTVGLENVPLTAEMREDLCDCLDAIAWSVHQ